MQKRKSNPPWRSKLIPFQQEILAAWYRDRATLRQIQSDLAGKGITISLSAISSFIRCRKRSIDPHILEKPIHVPPHILEKPIHVPPKPETPDNAKSLLDELTSKSLPELQKEWFKRKRKTVPNVNICEDGSPKRKVGKELLQNPTDSEGPAGLL